MKIILILLIFSSIFFNACYPITISSYGDNYATQQENEIQNNYNRLSEFETYIVENTAIQYDTSTIFNGEEYSEFKNPSFEIGLAGHSRNPTDWKNCGDVYESPVDIHGNSGKIFKVQTGPSNGNNFVGMVARDNNTYEAIGQALDYTLDGGSTYSFSLFAARSANYISLSRSTLKEKNFNKPVILKIYGGTDCKTPKLLISTAKIDHTNWAEYIFVFDVEEDINFILIEANYGNDGFPYNGNVLIDNLSPIYKISK